MHLTKIELKEQDYDRALDIWERSVLETHAFLKESDRLELKNEIPTYFKYVEAYCGMTGRESSVFLELMNKT
ncbi:hypothetical protein E2556_07760 [Staphylococcus croceilyticus]|uniref:GNAT family N-acetyltransferase n=1 Tax=Staphylococcus croceilyticus TaxID=319942 RepID=A0ABY2KC29_9STAP|nr:hypothetical protein [Staphylococcus croceilyticus]TGA78248.1 hypothetical protein E2556_07760 [Staphylococcus croceilyticus]